MSRFAQYLLKRKHLTREQLEEAVQHQAVYGARLGSNLVELKILGIEQLAECLSDFHHVALPPRKWLERPRRAAVKRVTRPLVERIRFIPLNLENNVLHAAVLDPHDPRVLDDLRFATGCRITPYVLPEIWMHDWLLALFKVPRTIRHIETDAGPDRESDQVKQGFDVEVAQAAIAAKNVRGAAPMVPAAAAVPAAAVPAPSVSVAHSPSSSQNSLDGSWLIPRDQGVTFSDAAFSGTAAAPPGASVRPPPMPVRSLADLVGASGRVTLEGLLPQPVPDLTPEFSSLWEEDSVLDAPPLTPSDGPDITIESRAQPVTPIPPSVARPRELFELEADLADVTDREQLIELSFSIAARFAPTVALFIVQRGMVQGARCMDRGEPRSIDGALVPVEAASMLTQAVKAMQPMRLDPRERAIDARVLELLGDGGSAEVGLFPVTIKQRVVNLLYASQRTAPLGPIAFAALAALAEQMGAAYGKLILSKKGATG